MPPEAEGVGERDIHPALNLSVRRGVEIAFGIRGELIDGRWDDTAGCGEERYGELQRAGPAEQVSGHGLGRPEDELPCLLAEDRFHRPRLGNVPLWSGSP